MTFRQNSEEFSEIVIGIIGPIGCNRNLIVETMSSLAKHYSYKTTKVGISEIISEHCPVTVPPDDQYLRVTSFMDAGNELRRKTKDNSILAKLAALRISNIRKEKSDSRNIYIIDSLKHPEEVEELRNIYGSGFYLFAVHSSQQSRDNFLANQCMIREKNKRDELIERDKNEKLGHGQSTSEAFHLADFFLTENGNSTKVWNSLERFFDIIFGDPFKTPTFHEYAMFMAHGASVRSSDMSRQVGAVITKGTDIISTGANECPKPLGGTYWPVFDDETNIISDIKGGRDYMNDVDRNAKEKQLIVDKLKNKIPTEFLAVLQENIDASGLNDLTEYGRVVHAEMDAILGCARRGISCDNSEIFCTTYPCHNCAKHIITSGINRVIYIEPYPKSKAYEMHPDSIRNTDDEASNKVTFVPFVGVGPRQFINLFSLNLSSGAKIRRKIKGGFTKAEWDRSKAHPRVKMFANSYIENEKTVAYEAASLLTTENNVPST
jgi:deoxycytidylate deaminase